MYIIFQNIMVSQGIEKLLISEKKMGRFAVLEFQVKHF